VREWIFQHLIEIVVLFVVSAAAPAAYWAETGRERLGRAWATVFAVLTIVGAVALLFLMEGRE
jgi:phosphoglycerol transferase MdoB-like AlkP superfamily enzyme